MAFLLDASWQRVRAYCLSGFPANIHQPHALGTLLEHSKIIEIDTLVNDDACDNKQQQKKHQSRGNCG